MTATTLGRSRRRSLILACAAVAFAAADTYVVVLALPDMMTGVGLTIAGLLLMRKRRPAADPVAAEIQEEP